MYYLSSTDRAKFFESTHFLEECFMSSATKKPWFRFIAQVKRRPPAYVIEVPQTGGGVKRFTLLTMPKKQ